MSKKLPIKHWSHSSLMAYLRNPLAWYKRYVELIYDTPSSPSGIVGRAAHKALEHYYSGIEKAGALELGLEYLRNVSDFEVNFGKTGKTKLARKKRRQQMENEYLQVVGFFFERPPRHKVVGVEVSGLARVPGLPLPVKAISDLVVESKLDKKALDIVDFKFVDSFSPLGAYKALFVVQAIFNYYTVTEQFKKPVKRFIVHEVKKTKNRDGKSQLKRYVINYEEYQNEFAVFHRLLKDATAEIASRKTFLPNPSDLFEGENSYDIYRLGLIEENIEE